MATIKDDFGHLSDPNVLADYDLGMFKYVRFADNVVLFCSVGGYSGHADIKGCYDVAPISAGMIWIKVRGGKRKWFFEDYGSTTLKLQSLEDDVDVIQKALPDMVYDSNLKWEY